MIHITVNIASTSFNTVYNMLVSTIWMKLALIRVCQKINKANPIPMGSNFPDVHRCSPCIDGHREVHTVFGQAHIRRLSCQESARTCRWYQVAVVTWHLLQKKTIPFSQKSCIFLLVTVMTWVFHYIHITLFWLDLCLLDIFFGEVVAYLSNKRADAKP